jgi:hypothetical protein
MFDPYHLITKTELAEFLGGKIEDLKDDDILKAQEMINNIIPEAWGGYFGRFLNPNEKIAFEGFSASSHELVVEGKYTEGFFDKTVFTNFATGKRYWIGKSEPTLSGSNTILHLEDVNNPLIELGNSAPVIITQECFYPYLGEIFRDNEKIYKKETPDWVKRAVFYQYQFVLQNAKELNQRENIKSKSLRGSSLSVSYGENKKPEDYISPEAMQILKSKGILAVYV